MINILPIMHTINHIMRSLILHKPKSINIFLIQQHQSISEIELNQIGNNSYMFMVLYKKLLRWIEIVGLHFCHPYCVYTDE